ncbi:hypothetical protein HanRHA438_Chr16g0752331 [Helianthus annuus]|nr:hypothetical protein HanIR_Chr16g0804701 [Helianthus annuus]KAJ0835194.1 hypothetical protein HanRHA438_Chr16g0752331 [Helianthus annuus]
MYRAIYTFAFIGCHRMAITNLFFPLRPSVMGWHITGILAMAPHSVAEHHYERCYRGEKGWSRNDNSGVTILSNSHTHICWLGNDLTGFSCFFDSVLKLSPIFSCSTTIMHVTHDILSTCIID